MSKTKAAHFKANTGAWLHALLHQRGREQAEDALGRFKHQVEPYYAIKPDKGEGVTRRDILESGVKNAAPTVRYFDFSPPPFFRPAFSILRADFAPSDPPTNVMSHPMEELLVPVSGKVSYSWLAPDGDEYDVSRNTLSSPVAPGQLIRINSSIPHSTWADAEAASAWMIFLDPARSAVAIRSKGGGGFDPRVQPEKHFIDNPEFYVLAATGIAETIRILRASAGMEITNLSELTGLDRATLSRVESFAANLSLEKLVSISEKLGFDAVEMLLKPLWFSQRYDLARNEKINPRGSKVMETMPEESEFFLSHHCFRVPKRKPQKRTAPKIVARETASSWIVLEGDVIVDIGETRAVNGNGGQRVHLGEELLKAGSVLHFKRPLDCNVETRGESDARILEVTYSYLDSKEVSEK